MERQERVSPENLQVEAWALAVRDLGWGSPFCWEQPLPVVSAGVQELFKVRTSELPSRLKMQENGSRWASRCCTRSRSVWGEAQGQLLSGEWGTEPHAAPPTPRRFYPLPAAGRETPSQMRKWELISR